MTDSQTVRQTKRLLRATLNVPRELWRGHEHIRAQESGTPEQSAADLPELGHNEQSFPLRDEIALKVAGDPQPQPALVPIRSLSRRHLRLIKEHLLALNPQDRHLRFGFTASDEQINRYASELNFERDEIYGIFNRRLKLIAMAHLALQTDTACDNCAEFGVSVNSDSRGKGLGTLLFKRAMLHARAQGVSMLFIHALSENLPMLKIARKAGAIVENYGGEVEAHIRLPEQDLVERVEDAVMDAVVDGVGLVDYRLKLHAMKFWEMLAALQDIRKGAVKSQNSAAQSSHCNESTAK